MNLREIEERTAAARRAFWSTGETLALTRDVLALCALVRQLGEALDRQHRMSRDLLAQRPVRDATETLAESEVALAAYREAIQ